MLDYFCFKLLLFCFFSFYFSLLNVLHSCAYIICPIDGSTKPFPLLLWRHQPADSDLRANGGRRRRSKHLFKIRAQQCFCAVNFPLRTPSNVKNSALDKVAVFLKSGSSWRKYIRSGWQPPAGSKRWGSSASSEPLSWPASASGTASACWCCLPSEPTPRGEFSSVANRLTVKLGGQPPSLVDGVDGSLLRCCWLDWFDYSRVGNTTLVLFWFVIADTDLSELAGYINSVSIQCKELYWQSIHMEHMVTLPEQIRVAILKNKRQHWALAYGNGLYVCQWTDWRIAGLWIDRQEESRSEWIDMRTAELSLTQCTGV